MKKISVLIAAAIFCAASVMAQAPPSRSGEQRQAPTPEESAKRSVEFLKRSVTNLTDDQVAKLTASYTEIAKEEQALREKQQELNNKREEALKAVLTPAQLKKYEKDRQDMMDRMRNRGGQQGQGSGGQRPSGGGGGGFDGGFDE